MARKSTKSEAKVEAPAPVPDVPNVPGATVLNGRASGDWFKVGGMVGDEFMLAVVQANSADDAAWFARQHWQDADNVRVIEP